MRERGERKGRSLTGAHAGDGGWRRDTEGKRRDVWKYMRAPNNGVRSKTECALPALLRGAEKEAQRERGAWLVADTPV